MSLWHQVVRHGTVEPVTEKAITVTRVTEKKRGRPKADGKSAAERMKAYRARKKG